MPRRSYFPLFVPLVRGRVVCFDQKERSRGVDKGGRSE